MLVRYVYYISEIFSFLYFLISVYSLSFLLKAKPLTFLLKPLWLWWTPLGLGKLFTSPSIPCDNLAEYSVLGCRFLSFSTVNMSCYSLLVSKVAAKKSNSPGWFIGLSTGMWTKGSLVRFPARTHAWVVSQVSSWGRVRGNQSMLYSHTDVSLHFFLSLKINK